MITMNLYQLLKNKKMTQKELIELTNIPKNTISAYCNNKFTMINKDHLDKMCEVLECDISDLIKHEKESKDKSLNHSTKPYKNKTSFNLSSLIDSSDTSGINITNVYKTFADDIATKLIQDKYFESELKKSVINHLLKSYNNDEFKSDYINDFIENEYTLDHNKKDEDNE